MSFVETLEEFLDLRVEIEDSSRWEWRSIQDRADARRRLEDIREELNNYFKSLEEEDD